MSPAQKEAITGKTLLAVLGLVIGSGGVMGAKEAGWLGECSDSMCRAQVEALTARHEATERRMDADRVEIRDELREIKSDIKTLLREIR